MVTRYLLDFSIGRMPLHHLISINPTRWTIHAQSIASTLANYKSIQDLWDEALEGSLDSEIKARIQGVSSQMETFQFFFGMLLAEMVFRHTDNLCKTSQNLNYQVYRDTKLLC